MKIFRTFECMLKNKEMLDEKFYLRREYLLDTSFYVSFFFFFYNVQNKIYIFIENLFGTNLTRLVDERSY